MDCLSYSQLLRSVWSSGRNFVYYMHLLRNPVLVMCIVTVALAVVFVSAVSHRRGVLDVQVPYVPVVLIEPEKVPCLCITTRDCWPVFRELASRVHTGNVS